MNFLITVGHSKLKNGYYTSADGRAFGGVLEYEYCKEISSQIGDYLRKVGHTVDVFVQPEGVYTVNTQEKAPKITRANGTAYDLVAELHLNATKLHNASGCEVIYNNYTYAYTAAKNVLESLSRAFKKRTVYQNNSLYMMNSVKKASIIIESFFCDSSSDYEIAKKNDVALMIAEGIHGGVIVSDPIGTVEPDTGTAAAPTDSVAGEEYLFRVRPIVSSLNIRKGPGTEYEVVGAIVDKGVYTILETARAKDGGEWGRLKSGAGWINVSGNYVNRL